MEEKRQDRRLNADQRVTARLAEIGKKERRQNPDRRKVARLAEENEISIDIIPDGMGGNEPFKEIISFYSSGDISVSSARIQGNILLPVNTIFKLDITLKNPRQNITSVGKVKWNKVILEDTYYEAGVEFIDHPDEAVQKLFDREGILKNERTKLQEINHYEIPPGEDDFIPVEEWSRSRGNSDNEIPPGEDDFIPVEEWSKTHATGKKKKIAAAAAARPVNKIIEPVEKNMKTCRYCAREIRSRAGLCEHCGRPVPKETVRKIFL
ncbi:MAG TPA: hypothetical protein VMU29_13870 [Smithella sp.]|nr:hypothetical protein [Smithella sp.]